MNRKSIDEIFLHIGHLQFESEEIMETSSENTVIQLGQNRTLAFRDARDVLLECTEGIVWFTIEGQSCDVLLAKGEKLRIDSNELALIQGLPTCSIQLMSVATSAGDIRVPKIMFSDLNIFGRQDGFAIPLTERLERMANVFKQRLTTSNAELG